jgi:hypothetical protein
LELSEPDIQPGVVVLRRTGGVSVRVQGSGETLGTASSNINSHPFSLLFLAYP